MGADARHMSMRRYRFVNDGLVLGIPETHAVVDDARASVKLWYRERFRARRGVTR